MNRLRSDSLPVNLYTPLVRTCRSLFSNQMCLSLIRWDAVQEQEKDRDGYFDLRESLTNNNLTHPHSGLCVNLTTLSVCYPNIFLGLTRVYALMNCEPAGFSCEADVEPQICIETSFGKQEERLGR